MGHLHMMSYTKVSGSEEELRVAGCKAEDTRTRTY